MTVYVDDWRAPATVGVYTAGWSHLFSDAQDATELHEFAASIGLLRGWFQDEESGVHYDVTEGMRLRAIRAGAVAVPWREVRAVWPRRGAGKPKRTDD